jgi:hypothetical protein
VVCQPEGFIESSFINSKHNLFENKCDITELHLVRLWITFI